MGQPTERCHGPGHNGTQCDKDAEREGLCRAHRQQKYDGRPLVPLRKQNQTRMELLREAAIAYADASAEDEAAFQRAINRLAKAAERYSRRRTDELSGNPQAEGST